MNQQTREGYHMTDTPSDRVRAPSCGYCYGNKWVYTREGRRWCPVCMAPTGGR